MEINLTSIRSILPFSNDLLQFINIDDWDGRVIKVNRDFYLNYLNDPENQRQILKINGDQSMQSKLLQEIKERTENASGIYILYGDTVDTSYEGVAYIGQTNNFPKRMKDHFLSPDERDNNEPLTNILFISKSKNAIPEDIRRVIESLIIKNSKKADVYEIMNGTANTTVDPQLSDQNTALVFYNHAKMILEQLSIPLLKEKSISRTEEIVYFICTKRGAKARMYLTPEGEYIVTEGSIITREFLETSSERYKSIFDKRQRYLQEQKLKEENDQYVLMIDANFSSSSAAAVFVTGGSISGLMAWVKEDEPNVTLGEYRERLQT